MTHSRLLSQSGANNSLEKKMPKVSPAALKDYAQDAPRLERMWARLDEELPTKPIRAANKSAALVGWAAAAAVVLFGSGVLLGTQLSNEPGLRQAAPELGLPVAERPAGESPSEPLQIEAVTQPVETAKPISTEQPKPLPKPRPRAASSAPLPSEAPVLSQRPKGPPEWQRLADTGEYAAAYQAIQEQGGFDGVMSQASADQLMTLAEIARANRQRGRASQALRQLLNRFAGDPNAPLAALALGNLLEAAGDRKGAAEAFGLYRSLSPDGDFAEDALARQVVAAIDQGQLELARKLVDQYEKDFPKGRRGQEIREALSEAEQSDAGAFEASDAGAPQPSDEAASAEGAESNPAHVQEPHAQEPRAQEQQDAAR